MKKQPIEQYSITLLAWQKKKQGEKTDVSFYTANSSQLHATRDCLRYFNLKKNIYLR